MGSTVLKAKEIDWGRYGLNDMDAAASLVWAKKLKVSSGDIKVKMRGPDLVEIDVKNMDANHIKAGVRK